MARWLQWLLLLLLLPAAAPSAPWTLHDADFPVVVRVSAFGDDGTWLGPAAAPDASAAVLRVSSTVLEVTVDVPPAESARAFLALFEAASGRAVAPEMAADLQPGRDRRLRLDVGTAFAQSRLLLRVYVEAAAAPGHRRALFAREMDLAPSEPWLMDCEDADADGGVHGANAGRLAPFPPPAVPRELCGAYTMGGRVSVRKWYLDGRTDRDGAYSEFSREDIEAQVRRVRERQQFYYGATDGLLFDAFARHPLATKHVLIVGSTFPWYEAMCLAFDAASCTTIDYNQIRYAHPGLNTYTVAEFARADPATTRKHFDAILSISSFEHDGLGRYGDPLAPDADLEAMRTLKQYVNSPCPPKTEPTKVFLVVPVGPDTLVWNAQRIYGPLRLPLLLAEWQVVDTLGFQHSDFTAPFTVDHQPVFVLQAPETCADAARPSDEL